MTRPAWHTTWRRMRRIGNRRSWMTWGEFQGLLVTLIGVTLTPYHVKRATATFPPVRVRGVMRYRDCHVQMAVGYAKARGMARIVAPDPEEATA